MYYNLGPEAEMETLIIPGIGILGAAGLWFLWSLRHLLFQERIIMRRIEEVKKLHFFESVHFGGGKHILPSGQTFYSDAHVVFVVRRGKKRRISGVIGGSVVSRTFRVYQLQGLPRGDYHDGTPVGEYLLRCAEQIAAVYGCTRIVVFSAERQPYYDPHEIIEDPIAREKHRDRMRKTYNTAPKKLGYIKMAVHEGREKRLS